ncbi:malonate decarboxylase holo-[acyl-carrier-protein] synthase [Massilia sp. AB1]|uniref:malonate decarboxylase holo-[acyl-carrier-protein] synthase n=1 Tax=Massilia sp. AB1 TaxID=2823371 RepID=UPI001E598213|nr:malonate decarboxylase holo-[acyl-carrier-protein] synthase [Massilia sp. AB1]
MFARHDLVWLTARGWEQVLAAMPQEQSGALDAWSRAGWPAVVRRDEVEQAPDQLSVGFALPPRPLDGVKVRVAARVAIADVARHAAPLPLVAAMDAVPERWRAGLAALEQEATAHGFVLGAYGSVALQAITGQAYLKESSDIDLLLRPLNTAHLRDGLALLARHAEVLPLDGEIVFPDGRAVAWKELHAAMDGVRGTRVLAKEMGRISLSLVSELLATLEETECLI